MIARLFFSNIGIFLTDLKIKNTEDPKYQFLKIILSYNILLKEISYFEKKINLKVSIRQNRKIKNNIIYIYIHSSKK